MIVRLGSARSPMLTATSIVACNVADTRILRKPKVMSISRFAGLRWHIHRSEDNTCSDNCVLKIVDWDK